jgi:DNA-binding transcriptional regulator YdaS (Cro superfamily)
MGNNPAPPEAEEAMREAFAALGGKTELARKLGLTRQAVSLWRVVPAHHVADVAELSGIPREVLRPDVFRPSDIVR